MAVQDAVHKSTQQDFMRCFLYAFLGLCFCLNAPTFSLSLSFRQELMLPRLSPTCCVAQASFELFDSP